MDPKPAPMAVDIIELESPEPVSQPNHTDGHMAADSQESESDVDDAREQQRRYVLGILQGRRRNKPRGFLREMWSFVVSDKN
jgi:hypothetical protein